MTVKSVTEFLLLVPQKLTSVAKRFNRFKSPGTPRTIAHDEDRATPAEPLDTLQIGSNGIKHNSSDGQATTNGENERQSQTAACNVNSAYQNGESATPTNTLRNSASDEDLSTPAEALSLWQTGNIDRATTFPEGQDITNGTYEREPQSCGSGGSGDFRNEGNSALAQFRSSARRDRLSPLPGRVISRILFFSDWRSLSNFARSNRYLRLRVIVHKWQETEKLQHQDLSIDGFSDIFPCYNCLHIRPRAWFSMRDVVHRYCSANPFSTVFHCIPCRLHLGSLQRIDGIDFPGMGSDVLLFEHDHPIPTYWAFCHRCGEILPWEYDGEWKNVHCRQCMYGRS